MSPRPARAKPALVEDLPAWLGEQRLKLSRSSSVAQPIDDMLKRWGRFAAFLDDGRIALTSDAAERSLRGFALGRKAWLFDGSDRGAERAAVMATLTAARFHRHRRSNARAQQIPAKSTVVVRVGRGRICAIDKASRDISNLKYIDR